MQHLQKARGGAALTRSLSTHPGNTYQPGSTQSSLQLSTVDCKPPRNSRTAAHRSQELLPDGPVLRRKRLSQMSTDSNSPILYDSHKVRYPPARSWYTNGEKGPTSRLIPFTPRGTPLEA